MAVVGRRTATVAAVIACVGGALAAVLWGMSGSQLLLSVQDAATGRPIAGAHVDIGGQELDASSGTVSARLPLGEYSVSVGAPGYESTHATVVLGFFRSADLGTISLRNAELEVRTVENFPGFATIATATVAVSSQATAPVNEGVAVLTDLPIGEATITASAAGYTVCTMTVDLRPGRNSVVCSLTPELAEVVNRHIGAMRERNYSLIYDLLHPNRQALWGTKVEYLDIMERTADESAGASTIDRATVGGFIPVTKYHDAATGKTYANATRVPVTYFVKSPMLAALGMSEASFSDSEYWVLTEGQWRSLATGERNDNMPKK